MVSKNKGDFTYGRFEARAKLPKGRGTWPAIWMLPTDWKYGGWPNSGEIDILEHVGYEQDVVHISTHTKAYNHGINTQKQVKDRLQEFPMSFTTIGLTGLPPTSKVLWMTMKSFMLTMSTRVLKNGPLTKTSIGSSIWQWVATGVAKKASMTAYSL
ncbi:glycoside hydrolase family 16 protein [Sphingobacterium sp. E70]|nr:glycoside hydrolase family 16 protein [Sphingobacterium sp. E70]ULT24645.1 glycoside hydrolase family 16 protein [Sphingobacterium sp. E70]